MKFTHLHTHSHYSLLDGLAKIPDLVKKAKAEGMASLALTDHGVMYGVVEFYQECQKSGIKPIIGVEMYLAPRGRFHKETGVGTKPHHLGLLVKNEIGYRNLLKLVSIAHLEGFYYKPRIDWEVLEKYHDGLVGLSACLQGEVPASIQRGETPDKVAMIAQRYNQLFGQGNFFLEVQHHPNLAGQSATNEKIIALGKQLGIPVVATNDVHYLNPEDAEAHDILLCLQTKKKKEDKDRLSMLGEDFSFRSVKRMLEDFRDYPQAIANTQLVVEACNFELSLGKVVLPSFELPAGLTPEQYLTELAKQGLERRLGVRVDGRPIISSTLNSALTQEIIARLEYELAVIAKTGFAPYLLIVQDFVNWAKSQNILVGPGRGSAAGSLVSYLLNITNVDPIKYDLLFERFLNPERVSMPDIDLDFADTRRSEVIRYVENKYGADHVAQIITFGTMAARAAVRDVGRVLNLPYNYCDQMAKLIPLFTNLDKALKTVPDLKQLYQNDPQAKKLLDTAKVLEGVARHSSTHACGVLITPEQLDNYVPLQYASSGDQTVISQYSLHPIEDLGLLKMDFLGLANLSILENALEKVEKVHGVKIDLDQIPFADEETFKLLQRADTVGVFQLESAGMRRYLKELKPTVFEDIIAIVALYRPGPMEWIPDFIAGKHGFREVSYIHPKLKPILSKTYGVAVYQEQIMQITRDLAGFTLGEADILRKAVGKKIPKLLKEQKEKFIKGCRQQSVSQSVAEKVFSFMEPFAGYGFNRAHATCYAVIAYQTAYLKAHYPVEFMAALMTADQGNSDRIAIEVEECRRMGIEVLPPDINESFSTFTVVKTEAAGQKPRLRFGLLAIKNLGANIVRKIINERKANGPYRDLADLLNRVKSKDLNKKSLESLIKAGALDRFGDRNQFFLNLERLLSYLKNIQRDSTNGQVNLFGAVNGLTALVLEKTAPAPKRQYLAWERELLGLYVSEHPLSEFSEQLKGRVVACADLGNLADSQVYDNGVVRVAGVITKIQRVITKSNEVMLFVKIEDAGAGVEVLVFPKVLVGTRDVWQEGRLAVIQGRLSDKDGVVKVLVQTAAELTPDNLEQCLQKVITVQRPQSVSGRPGPKIMANGAVHLMLAQTITPALAQALKTIFRHYPGRQQVYLIIKGKKIKTNFLINGSEEVKTAIEDLLGQGAVQLDNEL